MTPQRRQIKQIKAVMYMKQKGRVTNKKYQIINSVSNKTAFLELSNLNKKGILDITGKGRNIIYKLMVMKK